MRVIIFTIGGTNGYFSGNVKSTEKEDSLGGGVLLPISWSSCIGCSMGINVICQLGVDVVLFGVLNSLSRWMILKSCELDSVVSNSNSLFNLGRHLWPFILVALHKGI